MWLNNCGCTKEYQLFSTTASGVSQCLFLRYFKRLLELYLFRNSQHRWVLNSICSHVVSNNNILFPVSGRIEWSVIDDVMWPWKVKTQIPVCKGFTIPTFLKSQLLFVYSLCNEATMKFKWCFQQKFRGIRETTSEGMISDLHTLLTETSAYYRTSSKMTGQDSKAHD